MADEEEAPILDLDIVQGERDPIIEDMPKCRMHLKPLGRSMASPSLSLGIVDPLHLPIRTDPQTDHPDWQFPCFK